MTSPTPSGIKGRRKLTRHSVVTAVEHQSATLPAPPQQLRYSAMKVCMQIGIEYQEAHDRLLFGFQETCSIIGLGNRGPAYSVGGGRRGKDDRKPNTLAPLHVCLAFLSYSIRARTKFFVPMKVIGLLFRFFSGFLKRCLSCERLFTQFFLVSNKVYAYFLGLN